MRDVVMPGNSEVLEYLKAEFGKQYFFCSDCKTCYPTAPFEVIEPLRMCGGWISELGPGFYELTQTGGSGNTHDIQVKRADGELIKTWKGGDLEIVLVIVGSRDEQMVDWRGVKKYLAET